MGIGRERKEKVRRGGFIFPESEKRGLNAKPEKLWKLEENNEKDKYLGVTHLEFLGSIREKGRKRNEFNG